MTNHTTAKLVAPHHLSKLREFAQSILSAVQQLETEPLHPSWTIGDVRDRLQETVSDLRRADQSIHSDLNALTEEFLP
jgi:hypothetical protein